MEGGAGARYIWYNQQVARRTDGMERELWGQPGVDLYLHYLGNLWDLQNIIVLVQETFETNLTDIPHTKTENCCFQTVFSFTCLNLNSF